MITHRTIAMAALLIGACLPAWGCGTSRVITNVVDHPNGKVTLIETQDTHNYLLWSEHRHRFWQCEDEGASLDCQALCGGDEALACPESVFFSTGGGSNVR